jgi:hypothetical protein
MGMIPLPLAILTLVSLLVGCRSRMNQVSLPDAAAIPRFPVTTAPTSDCVGILEGKGPCPENPDQQTLKPYCETGVLTLFATKCGAGTVVHLSPGFTFWGCHYNGDGKLIGAERSGCIPGEECTVGSLLRCPATSNVDARTLVCERLPSGR